MPFFAGMYIPKAHGTCVNLVQDRVKSQKTRERERERERFLLERFNN